jgi:hypothetical protein
MYVVEGNTLAYIKSVMERLYRHDFQRIKAGLPKGTIRILKSLALG